MTEVKGQWHTDIRASQTTDSMVELFEGSPTEPKLTIPMLHIFIKLVVWLSE